MSKNDEFNSEFCRKWFYGHNEITKKKSQVPMGFQEATLDDIARMHFFSTGSTNKCLPPEYFSAPSPFKQYGHISGYITYRADGRGFVVENKYDMQAKGNVIKFYTFDVVSYLYNEIIMERFELIEDSEWKLNERTSRPQRGIRDFDRKMSFKHPINGDQFTVIETYLRGDNCPGWTGITTKANADNTVLWFSTCWDSSD